jgi:Zn-dependent protease with chaperone function
MPHARDFRFLSALALFYVVCLLPSLARAEELRSDHNDLDLEKLQEIAAQRASLLGIPQDIHVVVVPNNKMVISVERDSNGKSYRLLIDQKFMDQLDDDDVVTAIAHELGHVWIFTHHPYLQTEALANQIAMRTVTRAHLAALYKKLWQFTGVPGDIRELLGPDTDTSRLPSTDHAD